MVTYVSIIINHFGNVNKNITDMVDNLLNTYRYGKILLKG